MPVHIPNSAYHVQFHNGNNIQTALCHPTFLEFDHAMYQFKARYTIDQYVDIEGPSITSAFEEFFNYSNKFIYVFYNNPDGTLRSRVVLDGLNEVKVTSQHDPQRFDYSVVFSCKYESYCKDSINTSSLR